MSYLRFPENFLWGSATAGHQIEGKSENDWSDWESSARRLADLERKGLLEKFGKENYISGKSAGHYEFYEKDFTLAKELGHTAFRFSVEWSRVEPEQGKWNEVEIAHYRARIRALRELNIEPLLTLWHWPVPRWVRDQGGWESKRTIQDFARYAEKIAGEFKEVKFFITLNEPEVYAFNSYLIGAWPPQKKNPVAFLKVIHNLIAAH